MHINQNKTNGSTQAGQRKRLNYPVWDSNPQSLASMTSTLPTKPLWQFSRLGTNSGIKGNAMQLSLINMHICTYNSDVMYTCVAIIRITA